MNSSSRDSSDPNVQAIRESFARAVYSHKTHEKAREIENAKAEVVKWANIVLTALTSGTLLSTVITNEKILLYVSSALAAITLGFLIFQLSFNPEKEAERHRAAAKELWYVREKYIHLLTDIKSDPSRVDVPRRRDELVEELKFIYKFAPDTSPKAYAAAQKALKISEDMTFSNEEIDRFLPDSLHLDSGARREGRKSLPSV